ncbi:hypothetical protein CIW54_07855 [Paraburkholderia sp. T12-10]|nr:hypothetical protein CIW54_07855 [Paraburkholderia sp. T12-10]
MSFVQRQISVQLSTDTQTFDLEGLKVSVIISQFGGSLGQGQMQMSVWGMSLDQMNELSSVGSVPAVVTSNSVTVSAGDVDGKMTQVFYGTIVRSFPDFSGSPDVCFTVTATAGYYQKAQTLAAKHYAGSNNAETIIEALAESAGLVFSNPNNVHVVIRDQYLYGSAVSQITQVAQAAAIPVEIANGTVTIWPNNGVRDSVEIDLGPDTSPQLVGYPTYYEAGFIVTSQFNPLMLGGRNVNLTSSIPKANGTFPIQTVTHQLSTLTADGPWFTTCRLSPPPYVPAN